MQVKPNYWKHIGQSVNDCDVAAEEEAKQVKSFCEMLARTKKKLTVETWRRMHVGQHVSSSNRRRNPPEKMLSSGSNTTKLWRTGDVIDKLLCGSEKGGTSHVPRLRQVLERALRLLLWQRRSFLGSFKSDVVQMYPLRQATRVVGVFFSDA